MAEQAWTSADVKPPGLRHTTTCEPMHAWKCTQVMLTIMPLSPQPAHALSGTTCWCAPAPQDLLQEFQHGPIISMPFPEWRDEVVRHMEAAERIMAYTELLAKGMDQLAGQALREGVVRCTNSFLP
jgi:hypothetical protein